MDAAFGSRLFGPGMAGAGTAATGRWQGDTLALNAGDNSLQVAGSRLQVEAAGFNMQQMKLSWQSPEGEFALFIDPPERERFLAHAPQTVVSLAAASDKRRCGVASRFGAAIVVYGLILALPFILLLVFLMHTDRLAKWVADRVPVEVEEKIGGLVLAQTQARTKLLESGPAHDAIRTIGAKLTSDSRYTYRWYVAEGKDVNAFAAPGGVIVVYSGLIGKTERAEELAGVLAHEVAHVEQRHSLTNLVKSAGFGVLLSLALGDWSGTALGAWAANLTDLKFSRDAEMEADREGLRRLVEARIAPEHMANFFGRLAEGEDKASSALAVLSTHPPSQARMEALRRQIAGLAQRDYVPLRLDWGKIKGSLNASGDGGKSKS